MPVEDGFHGIALEMISPYRRFWLRFFDELAACQAGWSGVKHWSSEFAEMWVEAQHDGDVVTLGVRFGLLGPTAEKARSHSAPPIFLGSATNSQSSCV